MYKKILSHAIQRRTFVSARGMGVTKVSNIVSLNNTRLSTKPILSLRRMLSDSQNIKANINLIFFSTGVISQALKVNAPSLPGLVKRWLCTLQNTLSLYSSSTDKAETRKAQVTGFIWIQDPRFFSIQVTGFIGTENLGFVGPRNGPFLCTKQRRRRVENVTVVVTQSRRRNLVDEPCRKFRLPVAFRRSHVRSCRGRADARQPPCVACREGWIGLGQMVVQSFIEFMALYFFLANWIGLKFKKNQFGQSFNASI